MVTTQDINKQCFVRFKIQGSNRYTWENVGARIAGIANKQQKVILTMPQGEHVSVDFDSVRVIEPRPV